MRVLHSKNTRADTRVPDTSAHRWARALASARVSARVPLVGVVLLFAFPVLAQQSPQVLEAQAAALAQRIRCLTCQGQAIAESNAQFATDMRQLIRGRLEAGETPAEVEAFLIDRYGTQITFAPPLSSRTLPLWLLALLGVFIGGFVVWRLRPQRE